MPSTMVDAASTLPRLCALVILSLPLFVAAQNNNNPFNNGSGTPGAVIAGVVVAICIAILFLILFSLLYRRRRRGVSVLPQYSTAPGAPASNQNQGPYLSYPMDQQQPWGGVHNPPRPAREDSFVPPPPYPGKREAAETEENTGYGYPNPPPPDNAVPASGGFVNPSNPRPSTPPPAHLPAQSNES